MFYLVGVEVSLCIDSEFLVICGLISCMGVNLSLKFLVISVCCSGIDCIFVVMLGVN